MLKSLKDSEKIAVHRDRFLGIFPDLNREERIVLVRSLTEGSMWSINFGMMLGCSVIIAALGLLQSSPAVIIGAMLVAPLMTPLIGTGLALVQGNLKLLRIATQAMSKGVITSLLLGMITRILVPGDELTTEISLRGTPNILDLAIAFFAGVAAGYAVARPKLSGVLPGVAISVALVPPLTASGIALGTMDWLIAFGAFILFITNLVAIVLGSALVFKLHGLKTTDSNRTTEVYMKRILIGLGFALIILMAPLAYTLAEQLKQGQAKAESLTLSEDMWFELHNRLEKEDGIDFLTGVRANAERPEDVILLVTANRPVPDTLLLELDDLIDEGMGTDVKVKINVIQQGKVLDTTDSPEDSADDPVINE